MATIRQRISDYLSPDNTLIREELTRIYASGAMLPIEVQLSKLKEEKGDLFNKLVTQADYQISLEEYTDSQRSTDIQYSYQLYYTNGTIGGVVDRYLDFGLGRQVSVMSSSHDLIVSEAMTAVRNSSVFGVKHFRNTGFDFIHEGELLFVLWYDETTKLTTISRLPTKDITIVWSDPITKLIPLFYIYKSDDGDILYRDWRAQDEDLTDYLSNNEDVTYADELESNKLSLKHACVWAVGNKRHVTSGRGMPLLANIWKNAEYMAQFDDQRFAVSSEAAKYTESYKVQGGSTSLSDFINREADVAPSGSGFVGNEGVEREWNNNPTGANSERFNQHVWLQSISAATSLNGAILGVPSMLSNRSVLDKLMEIFIEYIEGFQNILADTIKDVFRVVVTIANNAALLGTPELFDESNSQDVLTLVVSLDTPVSINLAEAVAFINQQYSVFDNLDEEGKKRLLQLERTVYIKFGVR